jgi:hypothetical protein
MNNFLNKSIVKIGSIIKFIAYSVAFLLILITLPISIPLIIIWKTLGRNITDLKYRGLYGIFTSTEFFLFLGFAIVIYLLLIPLLSETTIYLPLQYVQDFYQKTENYNYDPYTLIATLFLGFVALIFTKKQSEIATLTLEQDKPLFSICEIQRENNELILQIENKGSADAKNICFFYDQGEGICCLENLKDSIFQASNKYSVYFDLEEKNSKEDVVILSLIITFQNANTNRPYIFGGNIIFDKKKNEGTLQPIGLDTFISDKKYKSPLSLGNFQKINEILQFNSYPEKYPKNFSNKIYHAIEKDFKPF